MRSSMTEGVRELRAQPRLFFALCALAALLMMTYGLARPPAKSMFAEVYGAGTLPTAWLVVAGTAIAAAWVYGWFAARIPISRLFFATTVIVATMFVGLRLAIDLVPHSVFLMYVVMETYIVVLVESFWSLANLTYNLRTARVAYGLDRDGDRHRSRPRADLAPHDPETRASISGRAVRGSRRR